MLALIVILVSCIRIVPQTEYYVIERLGKFHTMWDAGIHLILPFGIDRIATNSSTKEKVLDTSSQSVITNYNIPLTIDAVVYHKTFNQKLYAYVAAVKVTNL